MVLLPTIDSTVNLALICFEQVLRVIHVLPGSKYIVLYDVNVFEVDLFQSEHVLFARSTSLSCQEKRLVGTRKLGSVIRCASTGPAYMIRKDMVNEMQWFDRTVKRLIRTRDFQRMCQDADNKYGMWI